MDEEPVRKIDVQSSDKSKSYEVKEYSKVKWTCTCLGFEHRGKCKHINKEFMRKYMSSAYRLKYR
ncbi:SWIM zinc finger family protein [Candidatus Pacearchaeota archaeon]|nr:SWIM zinc finger family protein [Candidatus Pacearchaeota archaeon]